MNGGMEDMEHDLNNFTVLYQEDPLFEAECMLLGAIFLDPNIIHEMILEPFHFTQKRNQLIYKNMKELQLAGKPIDFVMLTKKLGNHIESIGGVKFLTDIAGACPTTQNIEHYQNIVLEDYKLRVLRTAAVNFLNDQTIEKAEDFYQSYIYTQEIGKVKREGKRDVLFQMFDEMYEDHGSMSGINCGFKDLNSMMNGWQRSDLIVIAARPSVGKTALALNFAMTCCKEQGVVDFFSLEMPEKQLAKRMLSDLTNIDSFKWKNPYRFFSETDQKRATNALGIYDKWNMLVHDEPRQTLSDIRARIQKTKREYPTKSHLVIIDYLQLLTITKRYERHDLAIGSVTRELKQIARQYEVPIVLLSQLSRGVEQRADKQPKMSDLRDSGSIEQDADVILLLSREENEMKSNYKSEVIIVDIAKQRNGPTGMVKLVFDKRYSRFRDLAATNKNTPH
ncbi:MULTISPECIES: replicative DNA helicase [unclassified Bacillus (in: firmicutes)]|uniref:replicative DNA helicase n=1 Tax=unclassified Bacillus (in: firmicutes) TaxID=185979 RepID=UPI0008ECABBF|nr:MULTISPECIES: replicative DNA helicase [unclassified Bacillus (in: firmicutes)]SFA86703.1 replicative DNA helicase [Bacillus sp. UNCCL13]SFQ83827.1 replicative DNA helicase [Bacillus sp. cl95]